MRRVPAAILTGTCLIVMGWCAGYLTAHGQHELLVLAVEFAAVGTLVFSGSRERV